MKKDKLVESNSRPTKKPSLKPWAGVEKEEEEDKIEAEIEEVTEAETVEESSQKSPTESDSHFQEDLSKHPNPAMILSFSEYIDLAMAGNI